jgi:hypothetical protein
MSTFDPLRKLGDGCMHGSMSVRPRQGHQFWSPLPWAGLLCIATLLGNLNAVTKVGLFVPYLVIILGLCFTVVGAVLHLASHAKVARSLIALLLAAVVSLLIWAMPTLYDGIAFVTWLPFHAGELTKASGTDQTIAHWDAWGWGTMNNDSFLVSDRDDELSTAAGARRWEERRKTTCEVLDARRMVPGIYIAITDGCSP